MMERVKSRNREKRKEKTGRNTRRQNQQAGSKKTRHTLFLLLTPADVRRIRSSVTFPPVTDCCIIFFLPRAIPDSLPAIGGFYTIIFYSKAVKKYVKAQVSTQKTSVNLKRNEIIFRTSQSNIPLKTFPVYTHTKNRWTNIRQPRIQS